MRISLLEKREKFYELLKETLCNSSFFKENEEVNYHSFLVNKYLNFIATKEVPTHVFQTLINEYSNSKVWWKKGVQFYYVKYATSNNFRKLFAQKKIELPAYCKNYLILGGNHRLRLFAYNLDSSIVLLKNNERENYIKNDVFIRNNFKLLYAPIIIDFGSDWFKESYFNGTPINRIDEKLEAKILNKVISVHFNQLMIPSLEKVTLNNYLDYIKEEIFAIIYNKAINVSIKTANEIKAALSKLIFKLNISEVDLAWSHGDFQKANILVNKKDFNIIDWESANKRFYLYDIFTLIGGIREGNTLLEAIKLFKRFKNIEIDLDKITENDIILILIEELRFYVNEDFSLNFYESGCKTKALCKSILNFCNA